jgi:hypothetical protein
MRLPSLGLAGALAAVLSACGSMGVLPRNAEITESPYKDYRSAEEAYTQIKPFETTIDELKTRGFDPYKTPNIKVMNYLDLLPKFMPQQSVTKDDLDPAVRACLKSRERCQGWVAEPSRIDRDRTSNVALDVLGFERETTSTGWKAQMLVLIQDDVVVYKLWSGTPTINEVKRETKPLGPFQDLSGTAASAAKSAIVP